MAKVLCKWGDKKWRVNAAQVKPIEELTYEMGYNIQKKKKEKQTITLSYNIYLETRINVRSEITSWSKRVGKKKGLYIGSKRFGPKTMRLTKVNASKIHVTNNGDVHYATIQLTFTQP